MDANINMCVYNVFVILQFFNNVTSAMFKFVPQVSLMNI